MVDVVIMLVYPAVLVCVLLHAVSALECFTCNRQSNNFDKCIKTVRTCDPDEQKCISYVSWGLVPEWLSYTERQYYISKGCATTAVCDNELKRTLPNCQRNWWGNWECMECCSGDLCNYYVTLAASSVHCSIVTGIACLCLWLLGT